MERIDPFKNFKFRVEIDGIQVAAFSEASIADTTSEVIEYREGTDPISKKKMSGMVTYGNITLKKGMTSSLELYEWRKTVEQLGSHKARKGLSLVLVDEGGTDQSRWDVVEAWPTKYEVTGLNATGNEAMIETIEIVHEGISRVK